MTRPAPVSGTRLRRAVLVSALALSLPLSATVSPAMAAEPWAGRAIADRWCASCHVVAEEQTSAVSDAPSFAAITASNAAQGRTISSEWLAFRLLSPHPQMPQVSLTRTEAADLAAYMNSLKK